MDDNNADDNLECISTVEVNQILIAILLYCVLIGPFLNIPTLV